MHVSLPIVVMAAVVAQGVTATPILQYESVRLSSYNISALVLPRS